MSNFPLPGDDRDWCTRALRGARLTVHPSLDASEARWRAASARGTCSVFQTFEWLTAWRDTVGRTEDVQECIVELTTVDGRSAMMLALAVRAGSGGRGLEFLGGDLTDYNLPLIDEAFAVELDPADVPRLWAAILTRVPTVDFVRLTRMPPSFDGTPNPLAGLPGLRHGLDAFAATLPATFEAFAAARSTQFFAQNRRYRRRLEKVGPVRIAFAQDARERAAILAFLLRRKSEWQRGLGLPDTFGQPARAAFYGRLTDAAITGGAISVVGLYVGEELVAALWGAVFRGRYAFLVTSYREDWAHLSVGRLLMESVVEACIADGLSLFDLTIGNEGYKASWSDRSVPVYEHLSAHSVRGQAYVAYLRGRARAATILGAPRAARLAARIGTRLRSAGARP